MACEGARVLYHVTVSDNSDTCTDADMRLVSSSVRVPNSGGQEAV